MCHLENVGTTSWSVLRFDAVGCGIATRGAVRVIHVNTCVPHIYSDYSLCLVSIVS